MFSLFNNNMKPKAFASKNANNYFANSVKLNTRPQAKPQEISGELLSLIVEHADICNEISSGIVSLRLSRAALKNAYMREIFASHIDRVCDIVVIWSDINASVVSVSSIGMTRYN